MLAAVERNFEAVELAARELREDREFMDSAVQKNALVISVASLAMQADRSFVRGTEI